MYQNGGAAGSTLAATGAATAMNYAWVGIALLTVGFAVVALGKLLPRKTR
jgi:LPXTG-motif cell wall-anchored protein